MHAIVAKGDPRAPGRAAGLTVAAGGFAGAAALHRGALDLALGAERGVPFARFALCLLFFGQSFPEFSAVVRPLGPVAGPGRRSPRLSRPGSGQGGIRTQALEILRRHGQAGRRRLDAQGEQTEAASRNARNEFSHQNFLDMKSD